VNDLFIAMQRSHLDMPEEDLDPMRRQKVMSLEIVPAQYESDSDGEDIIDMALFN